MIILTKLNKNNNYIIIKKRINLVIKYKNFILYRYDYYNEYNKFKDYYMIYYYELYKLYKIGYLNYSGNYHREYGHRPAKIWYNENGEIDIQEYWLNGKEYSYEDYVLEIEKLV